MTSIYFWYSFKIKMLSENLVQKCGPKQRYMVLFLFQQETMDKQAKFFCWNSLW